jgi:hypothetical protein
VASNCTTSRVRARERLDEEDKGVGSIDTLGGELNLHRRHLTGSQRAAAVVACSEWRPGPGRPENCAPGAQLPTAAQMLNVSTRSVTAAAVAVHVSAISTSGGRATFMRHPSMNPHTSARVSS